MVTPSPRNVDPTRSARHLFGAEQRRHRLGNEMSLDRLAEVVNYSKTHLHAIEMGERVPWPPLPAKLDAAFGTSGLFDGLWHVIEREQYPDRYRRFMELAGQATDICEYACHMVPGLLQTEAYARALLRVGDPEASDGEITERVATRLSRQERLHGGDAPYLWAILDETVIRRPVGGPAVMHEQFAALLPLVDGPRTTIQILPYSHGEHALLGGSLTLLTLPNRATVAYLEGIAEGSLIEEPHAVRRRKQAYDRLKAYALSPRESASLIEAVMEDYSPCEAPRT
jgi:transcriptional regulator with XRE-family HTH domain